MIVDDSTLVRARLVVLLSRSPQIEVVGLARTAPEAIERAAQLMPDVIILDIQLPGASGISIIRQLKEMDPTPIVCMLTNFASIQVEMKCKEAGADYFFDKSAEFEQIIPVIELSGTQPTSDTKATVRKSEQ